MGFCKAKAHALLCSVLALVFSITERVWKRKVRFQGLPWGIDTFHWAGPILPFPILIYREQSLDGWYLACHFFHNCWLLPPHRGCILPYSIYVS